MSTLILHLGTHKAASTSVQLYLSRNRKQLRERGICYPKPPSIPHFAHHAIAWGLIREYNTAELRPANYSLDNAIMEMRKENCETLILSSEDFLQPTFYDGFMEKFFSELRQSFDKIVVTAYVRNRKGFFTSSYNHWVKSLKYHKSFNRYLAQIIDDQRPPIRYTRALTQWGQFADESVYVPFLPKIFGRSIEHEILIRNGLSNEDISIFDDAGGESANASIGPLSVLAFRRIAAQLQNRDWFKPHLIVKHGSVVNAALTDSNKLGWNRPSFRVFSEENLVAIRKEFGSDDASFSERYFKRDWQTVFPDDAIADECTELCYDLLSDGQRQEVDSFVGRNIDVARKTYQQPWRRIIPDITK